MAVTFSAVPGFKKSTGVAVRIATAEMAAAGVDGAGRDELRLARFKAKPGEVHTWQCGSRMEALVGIGPAAEADSAAFRKAGAATARRFKRYKRVGVDLPEGVDTPPEIQRQSVVEGLALAAYSFDAYKSKAAGSEIAWVDVAGGGSAENRAAVRRGALLAEAVSFARDLVNEPGGTLTPAVFAERLEAMATDKGLGVKVWDREAIVAGRLGGLLGVNRGSDNPPRLVELVYDPGDTTRTLALVGKGVTFDAGGLSIKSQQHMMTMKYDMAGAAAVAGAMSSLSELGVACRVHGFIPMTDNMLGGDATRPGDVLRIRNGKTIEVLNTDAEGRLILADALSLACEASPDAIVDAATLTGACAIALGPKIAGLMGNNSSWIDQIRSASNATGEAVWHLPLPAEYAEQFRSSVADMANIGKPRGGALTAGLILQEFVEDEIPWAHLDIAGPAFSEAEDGEITKGGTGYGVRLLAHLAERFAVPAA